MANYVWRNLELCYVISGVLSISSRFESMDKYVYIFIESLY